MNHLAALSSYVDDVLDGRRAAGHWVRAACRRHRDDLARAETGWVYRFDGARAERVLRFLELLPHIKGEWAGSRLVLEPWQCFVVGSLFGWVNTTTGTRRFRSAYLCVPRKNAKSTIAAGIGLYMLTADGEPGAEVYSGASTEKQAMEVFRPAWQMARRLQDLRSAYGLSVNAKSLVTKDGSRFEPVVGKPGDGASPHCAIIDEFHEHQTDELYDTMVTGMGARRQPLALVITTAGTDISGPCYALQLDAQKLLDGSLQKEDLFTLVYGIDEGDDWTREEALIKANPNYDVSVKAEFLRAEQRYAVDSARKAAVFKTKHLNVWVAGREAWMNMEWWRRQADAPPIEEFAAEECWLSLDLSSKYDITAVGMVFRRQIEGLWHYYLFGRYYLPEETAKDPDKRHYGQWVAQGELIETAGDIIDYQRIEDDIVDAAQDHRIVEIAYDPWGATQTAQRLQEAHRLVPVEVPQTTKHLSEPMKLFEAMVKAGRLHHDGNRCLTWMVSNVTVREDANENVFPRKEAPENKIDGAVAAIMALGRAFVSDEVGSIYETRGLRSL